jgi:hypothetical protein
MTAAPGPRSSRPRSEARYGPELGTTYLLHFAEPFKHATHYRGWTRKPVPVRFKEHLDGVGSVLTRAVARAGIGMTLARIWPDTTRDYEDCIKHQGGARRMCPECGVRPSSSQVPSDRQGEAAPRLPRNRDRSLSRSRTTDEQKLAAGVMTTAQLAEHTELQRGAARGRVAGTERLAAVPPDDPWYSAPAAPGPTAGSNHGPDRPAAEIADIRQEEEMRRRGARAAEHERAAQQARQGAEADALFAEADRWADLAGEPRDFRPRITRQRAARLRERLGEDLVRDARAPDVALEHWAICADDVAAVAGEAAPQRGHEPELQGAERDAETDRLAARFGEPEPWEYGPDAATWRAAEAGAETDSSALQGGLHPEPEGPEEWPAAWDGLMARSNAAQAARRQENAAAAAQRIALGEQREHPGAEALAASVAAGRQLREARSAHVVADATVYAAAVQLQEAALEPDGLPRLLGEADAAPRAPEAWRLPDGTPHADPVLAGRGWQTQGGVYRRVPQAQTEAG